MTKKAEKKEVAHSRLFVFGLDENGKPRGARFTEVLDEVCTAALAMKCWLLVDPCIPADFIPLGMKLPLGRLYASGRAFIPNIRRDLYEKLHAIKGPDALFQAESEDDKKRARDGGSGEWAAAAQQEVACVSPMTSGLPRSWDDVGVGHMVLIHESPEDGWWEGVVVQRENEVLTVRFRDYPRLPTVVRHISAVALVNPGPPSPAA